MFDFKNCISLIQDAKLLIQRENCNGIGSLFTISLTGHAGVVSSKRKETYGQKKKNMFQSSNKGSKANSNLTDTVVLRINYLSKSFVD